MTTKPPPFPRLQTDIEILNRVEDLIRQWGDDLSAWIAASFAATSGGAIQPGQIFLPPMAVPFGSPLSRMTWDLNRLRFDDALGRLIMLDQSGGLYTAIEFRGTGTPRIVREDGGSLIIGTLGGGQLELAQAGLARWTINVVGDHIVAGNVVINEGGLLANTTDGFLYLSSGAGPPTGIPTVGGLSVPIYVDRTNKKVYLYDITAAGWYLIGPGGAGTVTAVSATAPLFITGGASPTPNVTIQGAIVSGSTSTAAQNLGALITGLLKGTVAAGVSTISAALAGTDYQAPITWPAATRVLISTGTTTDPGGDSFFTADTSNHILSAMNCVQINGVTAPGNVHLITGSTNNGNRDRVQFFVGGGGQGATGTGDNTLVDVIPISTAVRVGVTAGIYATERIERAAYTAAAGQTIAEAASLYIDNAPSLTGVTGPTHALHVAGGNTKLSGGLQFTETSGPTLLTIGACPNATPDTATFVIPAGSATVQTIPSHLIQGAPINRELTYYDEFTAGLITTIIGGNQWLATSGSGLLNANEVSYSLGKIVPNYALIEAVVLGTNTFTAGKLTFTIMVNGSSAAFPTPITIDSTTVAGTVVTSTVIGYSGSPAATDRFGVLVSAAASGPTVSATLRVSVTVRISAVAF